MYSESGQDGDPRSFFFVLSHPAHAETLARLLPAFFKSPAGWRTPEGLLGQVRAAILEVERASGVEVALALSLIDPPRFMALTRGEGVLGYDLGDGLCTTARLPGTCPVLPVRGDGSGWSTWSTDVHPGHRFMLALGSNLDHLSGEELRALATHVGRDARRGAAARAAAALAARSGALVIGRVNHAPWARRDPMPVVPATSVFPAGTWPRRVASVIALGVALAAFVGLARVGQPEAGPRLAAAHAAGRPVEVGAGTWLYAPPAPVEHPPLPVRGLLLAPCADGALRIVDRTTGTQVRSLPRVGRLSCAPILVDGWLVTGETSGRLSVADPATGVREWSLMLSSGVTELLGDRDRVWVVAGREVVNVDVKERRVAWRTEVAPSPITGIDVARGVGTLVTSNGTLVAFNPFTGETRWRVEMEGLSTGPPVIAKGHVYVASAAGVVSCHHVYRGKTRWRVALETELSTPPVLDGERVYLGAHSGEILALEVERGDVAWRSRVERLVPARLLVDRDRLVALSSDGRVETLDCRRGVVLGHRYFGQGTRGAPVLVGGRLIAVTVDGALQALDWRLPEVRAKLDG